MPDGDDPFRTASHGHSPTLARLANRHPAAEAIHAVERRTDTDDLSGSRWATRRRSAA